MVDDDGIDLSSRDRAIVARVLAPFADQIERVAVFGSRASGTARPASDIDLVVWGSLDAALLARLWTLFDESGLAVTIDIVEYGTTTSSFRRHIDAVARTLFTQEDLLAARADASLDEPLY